MGASIGGVGSGSLARGPVLRAESEERVAKGRLVLRSLAGEDMSKGADAATLSQGKEVRKADLTVAGGPKAVKEPMWGGVLVQTPTRSPEIAEFAASSASYRRGDAPSQEDPFLKGPVAHARPISVSAYNR